MTNSCTCKAEHWQPHADSCPQAKPLPRIPPKHLKDGCYARADAIEAHLIAAKAEVIQLRGNLSLAEEGLANYALEVERLRSDFKNFHRLLCERFGYGHDEHDWLRDQLSLIEWIAKRPAAEPSEPPQAPIAKIIVRESCAGHYAPDDVSVSLYAPGLPPGEHDVFCEPMSVAPALKSGADLCAVCDGVFIEHRHGALGHDWQPK